MKPSTITYLNPNTGYSVTLEVPPEIIKMFQWLHENTYLPQYPAPAPAGTSEIGKPPVKKYDDEINVVYRDAVEVLMPIWARAYQDGITRELQGQLEAARNDVQAAVEAAAAGFKVVYPS